MVLYGFCCLSTLILVEWLGNINKCLEESSVFQVPVIAYYHYHVGVQFITGNLDQSFLPVARSCVFDAC